MLIVSRLRQALSNSPFAHIIPEVYTWAPVSSGQGFALLQHMSGTMPDKDFNNLPTPDKRTILGHMADIFLLIQSFKLPETITSLGGLTFNTEGKVVSAQMTLLHGGPFATYGDMILQGFKDQLKEVDSVELLGGWKGRGIRERLEKFLDVGLPKILEEFKDTGLVAVHSDFSKLFLSHNPEKQR